MVVAAGDRWSNNFNRGLKMNEKNKDNLELAMVEALLKSYEAVSRERYPEETSRWFHIDMALEYWFKEFGYNR